MEIFELIEDYLIDQDDGLKKLLTWFLNLVMQLGYKDRSLKPRVGELILKKPQLRDRLIICNTPLACCGVRRRLTQLLCIAAGHRMHAHSFASYIYCFM